MQGRFARGGRTSRRARFSGVESGGIAFFVAALRESFEEAGILLAYRAGETGGALYRPHDEEAESRLARFRAEVNAGEWASWRPARGARVRLAVDRVHYFSHWITPEPAPKGSTRASSRHACPPGQTAIHDDFETVETVWIRPTTALDRNEAGEFDLIFPTVKNLQAILAFSRRRRTFSMPPPPQRGAGGAAEGHLGWKRSADRASWRPGL